METPTNDIINKYISKFNKDKRYSVADKAIEQLFNKFPENRELEVVLLKTCIINDLYSTQIYGTFKMAEHILSSQIDEGLANGSPEIVDQIRTGHGIQKSKSGIDINFYSFATKYCNWHNNEHYPIFDTYVGKILYEYQKKDEFSSFESIDLKNFNRFKEIILDFKNFYKLTDHNLKQIDKFLWIYGKDYFTKVEQ
jgi:hypothetical protein